MVNLGIYHAPDYQRGVSSKRMSNFDAAWSNGWEKAHSDPRILYKLRASVDGANSVLSMYRIDEQYAPTTFFPLYLLLQS